MMQLRACRRVRGRSRARTFGRRIKSRRAPRHACPLAVCEDGGTDPCREANATDGAGTECAWWELVRDAAHPCANTDSFGRFLPATRPVLHTSLRCVCKSGRLSTGNGRFLSVFAHAANRCVQKRTCGRGKRQVRVRFCTRHRPLCAKPDTLDAPWLPGWPSVHTSGTCLGRRVHTASGRRSGR
jgi:hypothetical protein